MPTPIGYYTASGIAALIGCSQFQTAFEAYQRVKERMEPGYNARMGFIMPEFVDNAATRWGHAFEPAVIKLHEEKTGFVIYNREKSYTKNIDNIVISCHVDGETNPDSEYCIFEGKTTNIRAYTSQKTEIELYLDENGIFKPDKRIIRKWGEPGTDCVPEEYQIQTAVQRICTGAELVKLSVLVFPKTADEFEDLGWYILDRGENLNPGFGRYLLMRKRDNEPGEESWNPDVWARTFAQIGNFHTYNLPSNPELEKAIITAVQEFHENHVLPGIPPKCTDYPDVRRKLTNPIGTILADDNLKKLCKEYSELTRQLGSASPLIKRKEKLKVEINNLAMSLKKSDWCEPPDKLVILDPAGGIELASIAKSGFRAKRAK